MKGVTILLKSFFIIFLFLSSKAFSDTVNKIEIIGNDRISDETIKLFISVNIKDDINEDYISSSKALAITGFGRIGHVLLSPRNVGIAKKIEAWKEHHVDALLLDSWIC